MYLYYRAGVPEFPYASKSLFSLLKRLLDVGETYIRLGTISAISYVVFGIDGYI